MIEKEIGSNLKTVQNKEEVFRTFEAYREEIYSFGVKRIGFFGSFVKRKQKKDSDVDVLVEFEEGKKRHTETPVELFAKVSSRKNNERSFPR